MSGKKFFFLRGAKTDDSKNISFEIFYKVIFLKIYTQYSHGNFLLEKKKGGGVYSPSIGVI